MMKSTDIFLEPIVSRLQENLPEAGDFKACLAFSLHKSGSTLLHSMVQGVCRRQSIPTYNIPTQMFGEEGLKDVEWSNSQAVANLIDHGRVYNGFRFFPEFMKTHPVLDDCRVVLLVRDPRDALVSQFFSFGGRHISHVMPKKNADDFIAALKRDSEKNIDDYVLEKADVLKRSLVVYRGQFNPNNWLLAKYEDVYFDKHSFLEKCFDHFHFDVPQSVLRKVVEINDVRPETEDVTKHIRKGRPGDHKEKLKPRTIDKLNKIFADTCNWYGIEL